MILEKIRQGKCHKTLHTKVDVIKNSFSPSLPSLFPAKSGTYSTELQNVYNSKFTPFEKFTTSKFPEFRAPLSQQNDSVFGLKIPIFEHFEFKISHLIIKKYNDKKVRHSREHETFISLKITCHVVALPLSILSFCYCGLFSFLCFSFLPSCFLPSFFVFSVLCYFYVFRVDGRDADRSQVPLRRPVAYSYQQFSIFE